MPLTEICSWAEFENGSYIELLCQRFKSPPLPVISDEEAAADWLRLQTKEWPRLTRSNIGRKICDAFIMRHRLNTKYKNKMAYEPLWRDERRKRLFLRKLKKKMFQVVDRPVFAQDLTRSFLVHHRASAQFPTAVAKYLVRRYGGRDVLDPFGGWANRLLGALAMDVTENFYYYDQNRPLTESVRRLAEFCGLQGRAHIECAYSEDVSAFPPCCLVLTSPPYIGIENYEGMRSYEDPWRQLYAPVFRSCWRALRAGGHMVINIRLPDIEARLAAEFGTCTEVLRLPLQKSPGPGRAGRQAYEPIMVWQKL